MANDTDWTVDVGADTRTSGVLELGKPVLGKFGTGHELGIDADWYKIALTAGEPVVFTLANPIDTLPPQFKGVELALRDAAGKQLQVIAGTDIHGPAFEVTPSASGTYFVDVRYVGGSEYVHNAAYELRAEAKPAADDYPAASGTTGKLELGKLQSARAEHAGDVDWFAYSFERGKTYAIAPRSENATSVSLSIVDGSGAVLAKPGEPFTPTASDTYYVSATALAEGDYAFTLSAPGDDFAATTATVGKLAKGGQVQGTLGYIGDKDWFKVTFAANTFYTFELEKAASDDAIKLSFMKSDGTALGIESVTEADGKLAIVVKVTTAGDYFANVAYGDYTGGAIAKPYTLKWSATSVADDVGDTTATAKIASIGSTVSAEASGATDVDVFKYYLSKGITYEFIAQGGNGKQIRTEFHNAQGEVVNSSQDGTPYTFTPSADGFYTLHALAAPDSLESVSSRIAYTIKSQVQPDDYSANTAGAGKLVVGSSIKGSLQGSADRDWIGVDLFAGQTYWLTLKGTGTAPLTNDYIGGTLLDAKGQILATAVGTGSFDVPTLSFKPEVSGTYYYEIAGMPFATGSYELTATTGKPDDVGSTQSTATALANGVVNYAALEVPTDIDYFKLSPGTDGLFVINLERSAPKGDWNFPYEMVFWNAKGEQIHPSYANGERGFSYAFDRGSDVAYGAVKLNSSAPQAYESTGYKIRTAVVPDDSSPDGAGMTRLELGSFVSGSLDAPADRDYVKIALEAGKRYVVDLYGAASGFGTLPVSHPSFLQVTAPDNHIMVNMSAQMAETRLEFTTAVAGDYVIRIGHASHYGQTGTWQVGAVQLTGDTVAPTLAAGLDLTVGAGGNLTLLFSEQVQIDAKAFGLIDSTGQHVVPASQLAVSVLHNVVTVNPAGLLQPGKNYSLELGAGAVRDLAGNALQGPDSVTFNVAAATSQATSGSDLFVNAGKGAAVDGGAGIDTVIIPGVRSDYRLYKLEDGRIQVQPAKGGASEVLGNIERIYFSDQALALDIDGHAGEAFRMFFAAFDRFPDRAGLGFWIEQLDAGASLRAMADAFINSSEFIATHGRMLSNTEFVDVLYYNILNRLGETAGINYWVDRLEAGISRTDLLLAFSESSENKENIVKLVGLAIDYQPG